MSSYSKTNGSDFQSSNIDKIVYDAETETMEVSFINAKAYRYKGVDNATAEQMATAESKGTFLNESIKPRFSFEAI